MKSKVLNSKQFQMIKNPKVMNIFGSVYIIAGSVLGLNIWIFKIENGNKDISLTLRDFKKDIEIKLKRKIILEG